MKKDFYRLLCMRAKSERAREKPVTILEVKGVERPDRFRLGDVPGQLQLRSNIPVQRARAGIDLAKSLSLGPYLMKLQVEPTPRA
jgi:DNA primase